MANEERFNGRVARAVRDIARALVPVCCPGCGHDDVRWCQECAAPWWDEPVRSEAGAPRLHRLGAVAPPVWSIVDLEGTAELMVEAWKDSGRRDLDPFFADAAARAARAVSPELTGLGALAVVPIPARRSSTRRRGIDLPALLARRCAQEFRRSGIDAVATPVLTMRRAESRGLSARARWRGAQGAMRVKGDPERTRAVMLIDDVMTTGATLATAMDALTLHHVHVAAALTLAAAPMRSARGDGGLGWEEEDDESSDTFDSRRG